MNRIVDRFDTWLSKLPWITAWGRKFGPGVWSKGIDLKAVPLVMNQQGLFSVRLPFTRYSFNVERA